jgi:hypothetical protein
MTRATGSRAGSSGGMVRIGRIAVSVLICLAAALASFTSVAFAAETETHVFNAALSLTGNCETSKVDPVADPSCPAEPPDGAFTFPRGVATDAYGDIYYFGNKNFGGTPHIYVFDASGHFLTEIAAPSLEGLESVAVDASGNLYAAVAERHLEVFKPSLYNPEAAEIAYGNEPTTVTTTPVSIVSGIAVDPSTNRILAVVVNGSQRELAEIGSSAEGNSLLRTFGAGAVPYEKNLNIAIDAKRKDIYLSEKLPSEHGAVPSGIRVLDFDGKLLDTLTGVETSEGFHSFVSPFGVLGVAVDESTGHLFVSDVQNAPKPAVYELNATLETVSTVNHSFETTNGSGGIAIDNGVHSPNSSMNPASKIVKEENPNGSYLFVPSGEDGTGHLFAFEPKPTPKAPVVAEEGFAGVTDSEAVLEAKTNPRGLPTSYRFEYVSAAIFDKDIEQSGPGHGFDHATSAGIGTIASGNEAVALSASLDGLSPGVAYRFRVVAANKCEGEAAPECVTEGETVSFATYPELVSAAGPCPNEAFRFGPSGALPDCRAYELVSPPDTNGHALYDPDNTGAGEHFGTFTASPSGDSTAFVSIGGVIPGYGGAGGFEGDTYVAWRGVQGWSTESVGPSGAQSSNPSPGALSPDHGYSLPTASEAGSLSIEGNAVYLRHPDGSLHLLGQGSLGSEPASGGLFLAPDGAHVIFTTGGFKPGEREQQLEPDAPPSGTAAIYDRTVADETTHVVSLLPGDVTPAAGEAAEYLGASAQGNAVAFKVGAGASPLYVRVNDAHTLEAAGPGATLAGISTDGRFVFYLAGGDLYRYDTEDEARVAIETSHDASVVNVAEDGTSVYFASPSVHGEPKERNPNGAEAVAGAENLYRWSGDGAIRFVGTVTEDDMTAELDGLGSWVSRFRFRELGVDPSRSTADGGVLLFESRADLSGYDSRGHTEVYRFDAAASKLSCLSCNPTGAPASSDARLQSVNPFNNAGSPIPTGRFALMPNLSSGGGRAFFESKEALVAADSDGVQDVYEWEEDGVGSCATAGGCIYLISSGQSAQDNYLFGVSETGDDVFISTSDLLVASDTDETASIYDARVGGGFAEPTVPAQCLGEACQPAATPPLVSTPASINFDGAGNVSPPVPHPVGCPAGKRKVQKAGKASCVPMPKKRCPTDKRKVRRAGKTSCVRTRKKHIKTRNARHARVERRSQGKKGGTR